MGVDFSTDSTAAPAPGISIDDIEAAHQILRGSYTHTLLEWTAVCFAAFSGALAFIQYRLTRDPSLTAIGVALICAGSMDAFHTLAADRLIEAVADNSDLIPFTRAICRLFNAMILLVGVEIFALPKHSRSPRERTNLTVLICVGFVVSSYFIIRASATFGSLPQTMYPGSIVTRPFDVLPILPYALCLFVVFPRYAQRRPSALAGALILSVIPQLATQLYMAFGSSQLHDGAFNIAHGLTAFSYAVPMGALMTGLVAAASQSERLASELDRRRRDAGLIGQVSALMAEKCHFDDTLERCLKLVCTSIGWDVGHVYVPAHEGRDVLVPAPIWYAKDPSADDRLHDLTERSKIRLGVGLAGRIWETALPAMNWSGTTTESSVQATIQRSSTQTSGARSPIVRSGTLRSEIGQRTDHSTGSSPPSWLGTTSWRRNEKKLSSAGWSLYLEPPVPPHQLFAALTAVMRRTSHEARSDTLLTLHDLDQWSTRVKESSARDERLDHSHPPSHILVDDSRVARMIMK